MPNDDPSPISDETIVMGLEMLFIEIGMLRAAVQGLLTDASPRAKVAAFDGLKEAARREPKYAFNEMTRERAIYHGTMLASHWINLLTPPSD